MVLLRVMVKCLLECLSMFFHSDVQSSVCFSIVDLCANGHKRFYRLGSFPQMFMVQRLLILTGWLLGGGAISQLANKTSGQTGDDVIVSS